MYTFDIKKSEDKLKELLKQFEDFKVDYTSNFKAEALSINAWHLTDWVFEEHKAIHNESTLGDFRNVLYPQCPSLKIMHDIANGSKHPKVSRPKANIQDTRKREGAYSSDYSREYDVTTLEIKLEDGSVLQFINEIESVIKFWVRYFEKVLNKKI